MCPGLTPQNYIYNKPSMKPGSLDGHFKTLCAINRQWNKVSPMDTSKLYNKASMKSSFPRMDTSKRYDKPSMKPGVPDEHL